MIHKWSLPGEEGAGRTKHGGSRGKTLQPDKSSLHSTISLNWISFYNLTSRPAKPQNWYYSPCSGQGSAMTMSANGGNHCFVPTLLRWALSGTQRQLPRKTKYTSKIAQTAGQDKWDPVEIHNSFFFPSPSIIKSRTSFYGNENIFPFMASVYFISQFNGVIYRLSCRCGAGFPTASPSDHCNTSLLSLDDRGAHL